MDASRRPPRCGSSASRSTRSPTSPSPPSTPGRPPASPGSGAATSPPGPRPFGAVGPAVVTAAFFSFEPAMVAQGHPVRVGPGVAGRARWRPGWPAWTPRCGPCSATRPLEDPGVAATAARAAGRGGRRADRAAGRCSRPTPRCPGPTSRTSRSGTGSPASASTAATATTPRSLAAGIDGCQAHVLAGAAGGSPRDVIQPTRGWSDEQWDAADRRPRRPRHPRRRRRRSPTPGATLHAAVEARTDELAARALAPRGRSTAPRPSRPPCCPWAARHPGRRGDPPAQPDGPATPTCEVVAARWSGRPFRLGARLIGGPDSPRGFG